MRADGAAILVIGNEVLSGSVEDINSTFLMRELRALGVETRRVCIVPDVLEEIRDELRLLSSRFEHVFTTGGVGPTHDDITFEAVAAAFDRPLVHSEEMERVVRDFFGEKVNETWLRLATVPEGTELVWSEGLPFPVTRIENVWVLPGEPTVMRAKFNGIRERFRVTPILSRQVWVSLDEGDLAELLRRVEDESGVRVGSYPTYVPADYRVRISLEDRDGEAVAAAYRQLLAALPPEVVVRTA
ncbi:MAG: molybdopterin-binding protein [Planctomycetota bacterium]